WSPRRSVITARACAARRCFISSRPVRPCWRAPGPSGHQNSARLFALTPNVGGARGAGRVEDDLVVLPEPLEEVTGLPLVVWVALRDGLHDLAERALAVDRTQQPVLTRVDGANEVGERVRPIDQHRDAAWGQSVPDGHRPGQANRNVVSPAI